MLSNIIFIRLKELLYTGLQNNSFGKTIID